MARQLSSSPAPSPAPQHFGVLTGAHNSAGAVSFVSPRGACFSGVGALLSECYAGACEWVNADASPVGASSPAGATPTASPLNTSAYCACWPGWSGNADFTPNGACGVHDLTVRILWGLSVVPLLLSLSVWVPGLREQYHVFRRKHSLKRWWHHVPLLGLVCQMTVDVISTVGLLVTKLGPGGLIDIGGGPQLIAVHFWPTFFFALWRLNQNFWMVANNCVLLKAAFLSPLARGDKSPVQVKQVLRAQIRRIVICSLPTVFIDLPLFIMVALAPTATAGGRGGGAGGGAGEAAAVGGGRTTLPSEPEFSIHRGLFLFQTLYVVVCFGATAYRLEAANSRIDRFFRDILAMPMPHRPRMQVEHLHKRVMVGQRTMMKLHIYLVVMNCVLVLPWWWTLVFTYWQPVGFLLAKFGMYKGLRGWVKTSPYSALRRVLACRCFEVDARQIKMKRSAVRVQAIWRASRTRLSIKAALSTSLVKALDSTSGSKNKSELFLQALKEQNAFAAQVIPQMVRRTDGGRVGAIGPNGRKVPQGGVSVSSRFTVPFEPSLPDAAASSRSLVQVGPSDRVQAGGGSGELTAMDIMRKDSRLVAQKKKGKTNKVAPLTGITADADAADVTAGRGDGSGRGERQQRLYGDGDGDGDGNSARGEQTNASRTMSFSAVGLTARVAMAWGSRTDLDAFAEEDNTGDISAMSVARARAREMSSMSRQIEHALRNSHARAREAISSRQLTAMTQNP